MWNIKKKNIGLCAAIMLTYQYLKVAYNQLTGKITMGESIKQYSTLTKEMVPPGNALKDEADNGEDIFVKSPLTYKQNNIKEFFTPLDTSGSFIYESASVTFSCYTGNIIDIHENKDSIKFSQKRTGYSRPTVTIEKTGHNLVYHEHWVVSSSTMTLTNERGQNIAINILSDLEEKGKIFLSGKEKIGNPESRDFLGHKISIVIGKPNFLNNVKEFSDDPFYDKQYPVLFVNHTLNKLYYPSLTTSRRFYDMHQSRKFYNLYGFSNSRIRDFDSQFDYGGEEVKKALFYVYTLTEVYDKFMKEIFTFYFFPPIPKSQVKITSDTRMDADMWKASFVTLANMYISNPAILFLLALLFFLGLAYIHSVGGIFMVVTSITLFVLRKMRITRIKKERNGQIEAFNRLFEEHLNKIGEKLIGTEIVKLKNSNIKNEKFCQSCGNKIEITDKFCTNCGSKIT